MNTTPYHIPNFITHVYIKNNTGKSNSQVPNANAEIISSLHHDRYTCPIPYTSKTIVKTNFKDDYIIILNP